MGDPALSTGVDGELIAVLAGELRHPAFPRDLVAWAEHPDGVEESLVWVVAVDAAEERGLEVAESAGDGCGEFEVGGDVFATYFSGSPPGVGAVGAVDGEGEPKVVD